MTMSDETMPQEGQPAPDFELPSTNGRPVSLHEFQGQRNVVLYFYPKDDTPGCTKEACSFRDMTPAFEAHDAVILGVSADSVASHDAFRSKYALPFPLLADEDGRVARAYGSWRAGADGAGGTARRNTFVIDRAGIVRRVYPQVKVEEHIPEVLDFITSSLQQPAEG
jgi:thioredoxin-dependent peroxiredoxin